MRHSQAVGFAQKIAVLAEERVGKYPYSYIKKTVPKKPEECRYCSAELKYRPKTRIIVVRFYEGADPDIIAYVHLHETPSGIWVGTSVDLFKLVVAASAADKIVVLDQPLRQWTMQEIYNDLLAETQARYGIGTFKNYSPHQKLQ